ncbi:MAG TPA: DEAD/DEAH box helicase [Sphingomicrobium sp.]|nr:DEAD/DEAH box helicase [Sphingomicrobium sp.]
MTFADLGLSDQLLRAVEDSGYTEPTPIQRGAIPTVLMGKDLVGIAQTGTGKTAGFVLPMIDILAEGRSRARMPRSLILEPTRELAAQVAENFEKYGKYHKLSMALLIGGVQMGDQVKALEKGVDVLIATPGRLLDLFQRGKILMTGCDLLVIDEADRMLDMGFIPDIEEICSKLPASRQTLLFSATMPPPIQKLAAKFLRDPKQIEMARPATANVNIEQRLVEVKSSEKRETLRKLLRSEDVKNAIIFCNRKTTVRELTTSLRRARFAAGQIQGDMDQSERIAELDRFKSNEHNILVASDVAARGLDIKGVSHIFNFDVPWQPDDYIHRIGRTGRAGATGVAITLASREEADQISAIEKMLGQPISRLGKEPLKAEAKRQDKSEAEAKDQAKPEPEAQAKAEPRRKAEPKGADEPRGDRVRSSRQRKPGKAEAADGRNKPEKQADKPSDEPRQPQRQAQRTDRPKAAKPDDDAEWNGPLPDFLKVSAS